MQHMTIKLGARLSNLEKGGNLMDFFRCDRVAGNVTRIIDISGVMAYLVEGRERAALIDTCSGAGNLKSFVERLTQKPVIAICTHGHIDHAGGAFGFDRIYLSKKDYDLVKEQTTIDFRRENVESMSPGTVALADYMPQRNGDYLDLLDGQVFDLGGITLEAIAFPGHTQGMTCVLVRELRSLLLGDGCNTFTFLFFPEASSVQDYKVSLQRLLLLHENDYDTVWFSHGHNTGTKRIVNDCIELCDEIMAGKVDNLPFHYHGQTALIARALNPDFSRTDGKLGNIVYNPKRVFNFNNP